MIAGGRVELGARDLVRATRFYVETMGMKLVEETADHATIDAGDGFQLRLRAGAPIAAHTVGLRVRSLDLVLPVFENRGVAFTRDVHGHATFSDSEGNALYLFA